MRQLGTNKFVPSYLRSPASCTPSPCASLFPLMYSREEVKAITDKIINMAKADAVEVDLTGGERSGTRWANSTITVNLVQYDRNLSVTVRVGTKLGDGVDARLQRRVAEDDGRRSAPKRASEARENPEPAAAPRARRSTSPVDAALPSGVNFGPGERARMVKQSIDICEKKGVARLRLHPEDLPDDLHARTPRASSRTTSTPKRASS